MTTQLDGAIQIAFEKTVSVSFQCRVLKGTPAALPPL
jgi:hypothetical protein